MIGLPDEEIQRICSLSLTHVLKHRVTSLWTKIYHVSQRSFRFCALSVLVENKLKIIAVSQSIYFVLLFEKNYFRW